MKLLTLIFLLATFSATGQIYSKSAVLIKEMIDLDYLKKMGFIIYDTTGSKILKNNDALSKYSLFNSINRKKIKKSILHEKPVIFFYNDRIVNVDSVLKSASEKMTDYRVLETIKDILYDSIGISLSDYENEYYDLNEVVKSLIIKKHNGIDYDSGIIFSDIVCYGNYSLILLKEYHLKKMTNRPIYYKLVVLKKTRKGEFKFVEIISSDPLM